MASLDELAERVERLLLRYEEQQRLNALLEQQVQQLRHERDNLRGRLATARSRLDQVIARLPLAEEALGAGAAAGGPATDTLPPLLP